MKTSINTSLFYLVVIVLLSSTQLQAQSNTFPSSGNVGIGTSSPGSKLEIYSSAGNSANGIDLSQGNSGSNRNSGRLFFSNKGELTNSFSLVKIGDNFSIRSNAIPNSSSGTPRLTINNSGNVGIGISSPSSNLHISSGTSGDAILKIEADTDNNNEEDHPQIQLIQDGQAVKGTIGYKTVGGDNNQLVIDNGWNNAAADILFQRGGDTKMIVEGTGNVGIGTTTPTEKLEVNGTIKSDKVIVDTIESTEKASISGLDLNGARNPNASSIGLNLSASYSTNIHITHDTWSGSHGLLFNSYQPKSNPSGGLSVLGNTKYANDEGSYSGGAGSIMYFGNYGNMGFYISPTSTGKDDDVVWGEPKLWLKRNGNVGIGTTAPSNKLSVAGTINSEEIIVEENVGADFVFEASYDLPTLQDIEAFIEQNQHLPGIAPASQMIEEGVKIGELQMQLLQKIEELTLYTIEQEKKIEFLLETNKALLTRIIELESD